MSINAGLIASTIYGGAGDDSVYIVDGASTAALIEGGVGNDFLSLGGLSGTSSVMGGAGADSITVSGNATNASQWLVDGGDDADSIYVTRASERSSTWVEVVLTASKSALFPRALFKAVSVTTPSMSPQLASPVHHSRVGLAMT